MGRASLSNDLTPLNFRFYFMNIVDIVQKSDTRAGRAFDIFVVALILFSIVTLSIKTIPNLNPSTRNVLHVSDVVVTVLFTVEYVLRIATAPRKVKYIFSFYGFIDLAAIMPFYLTLSVDCLGIRAFRLFQLFRIFNLKKYNKAMRRLGNALLLVREEAVLFLLATGILLYLSAVGIYYFEHDAQPDRFKSIPHSLWWALATLTTVGYGDIYPVTAGGKLFTFVVLMVGLGIVAVPTGLVASALSKVRAKEENET